MEEQKLLEIFGLNLKFARIKLKMSQEELAEKVDCTKSYISNVENAKHNLSLVNTYKFAKVLNVTLEELLTEK